MKLLCLNIWGGREHAPLLDYLAAVDADVLCLQEVIHTPTTPQDWLEYRDGDHILAQRARLFDEIAAALPGHSGTFCPAARGDLWLDDAAVPSFWGLATFLRRDIPVIGQSQAFVHKDYGVDGYGNHPRSRNAHAIRLYDHVADRAVTIVHTHGLRDLSGKHDTAERRAQAHRLAELTRTVAKADDAVIVCGDLNVEPDSETLTILSRLGLTELVTARGMPGTRSTLYRKTSRFADYMLVSNTLSAARFDVVTAPVVSDHCPLVLEF